ncbi:RDD family protein [Cytobacillus sp. IB215665]|uniref:RDD family protein n=1 Tax=Cytobacillus sp. IB215665 TaxID=3097357 RepID=UPI002A0B34C2|nr:RDD family protein [Cytobacillus sp. IB215665]MDX8365499.1 RDD family protein [Cytobacillus sp. IB215665]
MCNNPVGLGDRAGAIFIDLLCCGIPLYIISYLIFGNTNELFYNLFSNLYYVLVPTLWYGYTIGKKFAGIRIVKKDGSQVGILTMIMREFVGHTLYLLTFGIGYIVSIFMVFIREDKRAIHDFIAGTYVTYDKPEKLEDWQAEGA